MVSPLCFQKAQSFCNYFLHVCSKELLSFAYFQLLTDNVSYSLGNAGEKKNWPSPATVPTIPYRSDTTAWSMQASLEPGHEIQQTCKWHESIQWLSMNAQQRSRSMRLVAILKSSLGGHAWTSTLINAFSEGINLASTRVETNAELQASNGFELLRQSTPEFSIR